MKNFVLNLWERLFPKPSPWVVNLCDLLEQMPFRFKPTNMGDGYYKLELIDSNFQEVITFSFEESTIGVESLHAALEFNSKECNMLRDAVERWADSAYGQDFLERCDEEELDAMKTQTA